jgi:hypothetical protein
MIPSELEDILGDNEKIGEFCIKKLEEVTKDIQSAQIKLDAVCALCELYKESQDDIMTDEQFTEEMKKSCKKHIPIRDIENYVNALGYRIYGQKCLNCGVKL